ncbi:MAG: hypothetical protein CMJ67_07520 [Planctomycetaceae bacterium]|nr:hypothetical protein [Planctomycetaceae bacterium]
MPSPPPTSNPPGNGSLVVARIPWFWIAILLLMAFGTYFLDELAAMAFSVFDPPGDVDQELRALQQFGQFGSLIIVAILVWQLQPPTIRRTLLDLGLATLIGTLVANAMKTVVGRVRPPFGTPDEFHPIFSSESSTMTWSQLASMPSSHTMAAAVLATWMYIVFPRLRWFGFVMVGIVGLSRIRFNNHWPSDVFVGAALGIFIGSLVIGRLLGTRLLDGIWVTVIDRNATPAATEVAAAIRERQAAANA